MEKEGYVSLWIGNIKSDDELMAYVELEYTDDGDCIPSKFLKDFSIDIDDFDEDFIERVCHENKVSSISELISGCSYEEIILPKIEEKMEGQFQDKVNSAILLYNFDFDEKIDRLLSILLLLYVQLNTNRILCSFESIGCISLSYATNCFYEYISVL